MGRIHESVPAFMRRGKGTSYTGQHIYETLNGCGTCGTRCKSPRALHMGLHP